MSLIHNIPGFSRLDLRRRATMALRRRTTKMATVIRNCKSVILTNVTNVFNLKLKLIKNLASYLLIATLPLSIDRRYRFNSLVQN